MRSITYKNIRFIIDNKFPMGSKLQKSSENFISGYINTKDLDTILLQRGYRQYGYMQPETLSNLELISTPDNITIDYILNVRRKCYCDCSNCADRKNHHFINCRVDCLHNEIYDKRDILSETKFQQICNCDCEFCFSGLIITNHRKMDCVMHCKNSEIRKILFES